MPKCGTKRKGIAQESHLLNQHCSESPILQTGKTRAKRAGHEHNIPLTGDSALLSNLQ